MSHTVTIKTQFKDEAALAAACREMGIAAPVRGTASLFQSQDRDLAGLIVRLPGWHYPVIVDTANGTARFDNYNGHWGKQSELDRLTQLYAVHKATLEARRKGWSVTRQPGANGTVKLIVTGV